MATNSIDNPGPNPKTDLFNPELWNDNTKNTGESSTSVLPDNIATLSGSNVLLSLNTFNQPVMFNSLITYNNAFILNQNTALPNNFSSYSLPTPLSSTYLFRSTFTNGTITLPAASNTYLGCYITFRRAYSDPYAATLSSASNNIFNLGTKTFTNNILGSGETCTDIVCLYNSSGGGVYNWYMLRFT
jgi:hypothetical protein